MTIKPIVAIAVSIMLFSFLGEKETIDFKYPKNKDAVITMTTDKFQKFKEEWRDNDYYYLNDKNKDGFICSVLFCKLNKEEMVFQDKVQKESGVPSGNAVFPLQYFISSSTTKEYESGEKTWGDPDTDFMFRQVDIKEVNGHRINQKNMFAYTMFGKDLYVSVHLSKVLCTPADSIAMELILEGLKKKK